MHTRTKRHGFVLPITVIILTLISIALLIMTQRADGLRTLVRDAQAEHAATQAIDTAQAEMLFLSSALHRRQSRLGDIELDGRWYRSQSGALVRHLDAGAALGLYRVEAPEFRRLLEALDLKDPRLIDRLVDEALDYIDSDDLERLNGREARGYTDLGQAAPRNAPLLTPYELRRLPSWQQLPDAFWLRFVQHVHTSAVRSLNLFTVSAPVLSAATRLDPSQAQELVQARLAGQMLRIESSLIDSGGSYLAQGRFINVPSNTLLVTFCHPDVQWCRQLSVSSWGESRHAPWRINYALRLPRVTALPPSDQLPPLPDQLPTEPPPPLYNPINQLPQ